jgi:hypothetical protein
MVGALRIASNEIGGAIKDNNRPFFAPGTNGRLLGAANDYLINNKINEVSDANDFIGLVGDFHNYLASVGMKSPEEFAELNRAVINGSNLTDRQILNLSVGFMNNSDAQMRSILNISANVAVGEAAGAVGTPVGRGPIGVRINSGTQQAIVDAAAPVPLYKSTFGHTFVEHGQSVPLNYLMKRASGGNAPVGQFLNDQAAAKFIKANLNKVQNGAVTLPLPSNIPARVVMPDGSIRVPSQIRMVPGGNGVKTAYPEL